MPKGSANIASAIESDQQSLKPSPSTNPKQRRVKGKRSDEAYTMLSVLVPKELKNQLKKQAIDRDLDLSDYVKNLLEDKIKGF